MTVQDWHAHAEQVATPARTTSEVRTPVQTSLATSVPRDLAADLATLTRVLLAVGVDAPYVSPATAAVLTPSEPQLREPEPAAMFEAPALVEVPSLVEVAAAPQARARVSADRLIDDLGFLDV